MPVSATDLSEALKNALPISHLDIQDTSSGCGENYSILVVSEAFQGKSTLARHRWINDILKDYISQIHAFSQKSFTPAQYEAYLAKTQESGGGS